MTKRQKHLHWPRILALLATGLVVLATTAAASESSQVDTGRLSAVAPAAYTAMKAQAERGPAAQAAEALGESADLEALAPAVTNSFVGLDQANAGGFIPPDTIVGKSNTRVLEAVNVSLRLFNAAAPNAALATSTLNTFFGAATAQGTLFDPKVYYDRNAVNRRFYVVALQKSGTTPATSISRIWLAVSRSPDPANLLAANWCRYQIDGRRNLNSPDLSWADYPGLGLGVDKGVITANQFRFTNNTFTFAIVRVFKKLVASKNAAACPTLTALGISTFQPSPTIGDGNTFTLQPAQQYTTAPSFAGTSNPVYLVNSIFGTSPNYRVWRVRNLSPVSLQGPTTVVGNFPNSLQPEAPQDGSATLLDTGDTRVTQAAGRGNLISAVHGTGCQVGGPPNVSCVRHMRFSVGQSGAGALTATINDQTVFGFGGGTFIFWPGVAVNSVGETAIPYHRNRNTPGARFLSSFVLLRIGASLGPIFPITSGTCGQPFNRTGDYIGAQTDPTDFRSFWLAGERATTVTGTCKWQTQIIKVRLP